MKKYFSAFLVFILLLAVNLISAQIFTRFDFSEGNLYTLSATSKEVVKNLPQTLEIKVFLSKKIPPQANKMKQDLVDALGEYEALAKGKLKISYLDPSEDEEAAGLAQSLSIAPINLQIFEKDQRQVLKTYLGLAVLKSKEEIEEAPSNPLANYEKWETLPLVDTITNFEFDFTSAIKKVSMEEEKTVGVLADHDSFQLVGENQDRQNFSEGIPLLETLQKNFQIKNINLEESETIDCDVLLIANPQSDFSEGEIVKIQAFLKSGGNVIALLENFTTDGMLASKQGSNFSNLLAPFGLRLRDALVKDSVYSQASFSQGFFSFTLPYPFWVKSTHFSANPIVSKLDSLTFVWVSPLEISSVEGVNVETLATTSTRYALATQEAPEIPEAPGAEGAGAPPPPPQPPAPISLDPQQDFNIPKAEKDALPLAVIAQKEGEGKLLVAGDADFVSNRVGFIENKIFLLNAIDSFTIGDDLISIRAKAVNDRPLKEISAGLKNTVRWLNILGIPLVFSAYGIYRRWERKNKKKLVTEN